MADQADGTGQVAGDGGRAGAERRADFFQAVIDGGPPQLHAQAARAGRHDRAGIGAFPDPGLGAPAAQGEAGLAEQGIGQGREAGGEPVEQIVEAGGKAAEQVVAFGTVAPHRIQGVGEAEEQGARPAQQGEPEQGAEDGIVAVFQHRFHAGLGDAGGIELGGVARDHPADALACLFEVAAGQGAGDGLGMFAQALRAEGEVKQADVQQQPSGWRQGVVQPVGSADPGQHGKAPGEDAQADPALVEAALERPGQIAKADQRMPALRLTQQAVDEHGGQCRQRERPGAGQQVGHAGNSPRS